MQKKGREAKDFIDRTGEEWLSYQGHKMIIIKCEGSKFCTIKFENGHIIENIQYDRIKRGGVNNPYHPSVFNIGYLGVGKYDPAINKTAYIRWSGIMERVNSEKAEILNPSYHNVTVCEEWKCFQNFADWFYENYKADYMQNWDLDKDILFKENKHYSPESSRFVPQEINKFFIRRKTLINTLPIGVSLNKGRGKMFKATMGKNGRNFHIGYFNTVGEASNAYIKAKEYHAKCLAEIWKPLIHPDTYKALLNYKVYEN